MNNIREYVKENLFRKENKLQETELQNINLEDEYEVTNVSTGEILRMTGQELVDMFGEREALAALQGESNTLNVNKVEPNA